MPDEKQPQRPIPPRRPTLPRVTDDLGERAPTNDELIPVGLGGKGHEVDLIRTAKLIRRALMIVGGTVITLIVGFQQAISWTRDHADKVAEAKGQEAKQKTEDVYQPLLHKVEALTDEVLALRKVEAERRRAEAARARKAAHRAPVAESLPPVPPALTKPLPRDVDTAAKLAAQAAAVPSSRAVDGGP